MDKKLLKLRQGCGKEFVAGDQDVSCGDDFPDDDGNPFSIYCDILGGELIKNGETDEMFIRIALLEY